MAQKPTSLLAWNNLIYHTPAKLRPLIFLVPLFQSQPNLKCKLLKAIYLSSQPIRDLESGIWAPLNPLDPIEKLGLVQAVCVRRLRWRSQA